MEKKICPWCGKEMKEDCFGDYHCLCNKDIQTSLMDNEELIVLISGVEVDNLVAMKAEHAKLKAENEELKKTPVMHCGEIYFIKADEEEVNRILEENEKWKDRIKIVQKERDILRAEAERTRWHSVAEEGLPTIEGKYKFVFSDGYEFTDEIYFIQDEQDNRKAIAFTGLSSSFGIVAWRGLSKPYKGE